MSKRTTGSGAHMIGGEEVLRSTPTTPQEERQAALVALDVLPHHSDQALWHQYKLVLDMFGFTE